MLIVVAAVALLLSPAPLGGVLLAVLALAAPLPALVVIAGWATWSRLAGGRRRLGRDPEASYLAALAAELRAGHGLRASLEAAAARTPDLELHATCRLASAGRPIEEVAKALRAALPSHGGAAAEAVRIASSTGGRTAAVFDSLAAMAREEAELAEERTAAAAQARLSAAIVAGIPLAVLGVTAFTGRLGDLLAGGVVGMVMVALGVGLLATGSAWVVGLLRKGPR